MLKQSKTQISLIVVLGLMILGQVGFVIYQNFILISEESVETQAVVIEKKLVVSAGSAKAFGLNRPQEKYIQVDSVKELGKVFNSLDYTLAKAKSEGHVPRLFLSKLPQDMKHKKKSSNSDFVQVLLPHILRVNEQILSDRERLLEMQERKQNGQHLRHSEKMWLSKLASEYRCKSTKIESLLMHVDIVPPSLALAQGILETGGGRSHAALKKNSPFGYMATKTKVAKFESLQHSVEAYVKNLNRHQAYSAFRKVRASLRAQKRELCGHKLASCLTKYSVRGAAYTRDLQHLIHNRGLKAYDGSHVHLKP
ncbi:MAG: glucosaminidase domain-containing protein [Alphaproteobacteria bacterium]|nr:glucosaminidase domain-containing protein [Alphaproteobacteria bacterium]